MTAPEPLGPALAAELGGEWDAKGRVVCVKGHRILCQPNGQVWANIAPHWLDGPTVALLGSFSDGAAALARRARRLGVA